MTPTERRAREQRLQQDMRAEWLRVEGSAPVLLSLTFRGRPADCDRLTPDQHRTLLALLRRVYFGDGQ